METSRLEEIKDEHLSLNSSMIQVLSSIAKWTKFFAILGFVSCGLLVVLGIFYTTLMSSFYDMMPQAAGGNRETLDQVMSSMSAFIAIFYILIAALYFFPAYYLLQFSTKMKVALANYDNTSLEKSFTYLKSHYKFIGIMTIVILSFYAFILLIAGITAVTVAM